MTTENQSAAPADEYRGCSTCKHKRLAASREPCLSCATGDGYGWEPTTLAATPAPAPASVKESLTVAPAPAVPAGWADAHVLASDVIHEGISVTERGVHRLAQAVLDMDALRKAQAPVAARPTVDAVSEEIGFHPSGWDCVDPQKIIDAVLRLAAPQAPAQALAAAGGTAPEMADVPRRRDWVSVMSNLLWAAEERDRKNRIREFDDFVSAARAAISAGMAGQPDICDSHCTWLDHAPGCERAELTDEQIEAAFTARGGRWNGDYWRIEDADLHPFVRSIRAPGMTDAVQAAVLAERERCATLCRRVGDNPRNGDGARSAGRMLANWITTGNPNDPGAESHQQVTQTGGR